jgi:putative transposase
MGTATFTRNQLMRIDGKDCRLLRRVDDDTAWLMEEVQTGRNRTLTDSERNRLYREGKLTLIVPGLNDRVVGKALADGLNEKNRQWGMAKVRRAFVLLLESMSTSVEERKKGVLELWEKIGRPQTKKCSPHRTPKPPTLKAISEWRKRFISGGRDTLSLIERTANCGNRARRMPEMGLRLIREAINEVYLTQERPPLKAAVDEATARIHAENSQRPAGDQIPTPSYKLVLNTLRSDYDQFDIDVCRYGREEATKRYRRVCKHHDGLKPNVEWQIDHTVLDVIAIDDQSGLPLGRPCIAIAIDVGSRMIMGIYISFYPPCQLTLYGCLKEAILPKDWVREKYPDIENDWPAVGLPDEILVDRAMENFANGLLGAMGMAGVTPRQAPRKMPWLKPFVERVNGTIERDLMHQIPGTTFSNVLEKMGYDPSKHAVVKYSILRKVIYKWIVDVYHQTFHRTLQTSAYSMGS